MVSTERIRVLVVDDHPVVRSGLLQTLESDGDIEVVGQAANGVEAVALAQEVKPQVIVMDVMMPEMDGIDACRDVMELLPETRVLMLTASTDEDAVVEAVAAGATGYLQKFLEPEELITAVRRVAGGRLAMPEESVRRVFAMIRGHLGLE